MWPRKLTQALGIDEEKFTQALIKALQSEAVQATLQKTICAEIRKELKDMRDLIAEQNSKIGLLEKKVAALEAKYDDVEQYSRRNSLRIFGLEEEDTENPVAVTLKLINKDLGVQLD